MTCGRVAVLLIILPRLAFAASCGGLLNPVLVSADLLVFGNYSANGAGATAHADITAACTTSLGGVTLPGFTVKLSEGGAGSFSPRKLALLLSSLNYNLYTAGDYSTVWGDGTGGTGTRSYAAGEGVALKRFTVYGRIPPGQYVTIGAYADLITITVEY